LIVNELVSNALKHAFPNGRGGQVVVEVRSDGEESGQYRLVIWDDGVGIPTATDVRNTASLGLQLVNSLIRQIGGTVNLCRENGTRFDIRFSGLRAKI
jgi:two-component sensor histidine kinase